MRKLILVGVFTMLAILMTASQKAEAWWPPGPCYASVSGAPAGTSVYELVTPCEPSNKQVTAVWSGGFSANVGVMAPNGTIFTNGTWYSGCYISSTPGPGTVNNGFWIPSGTVVVGLRDCLSGVTLTSPPNWVWPWPTPPVVVTSIPPAPSCGSWNNWCNPYQPQPLPAPSYQTYAGCLTTGNIAYYVGGNSSYWSVIPGTNNEGLKYIGPLSVLVGPSQGRVDTPSGPIRYGQVTTTSEATYWCRG